MLNALSIVRPRLSFSRDRDGRYSIQDLIDKALATSSEPLRFSLNNIEVDDGAINFADGVTGRNHGLAALNIGIPFLSSLPYQTDILVTPRVGGTSMAPMWRSKEPRFPSPNTAKRRSTSTSTRCRWPPMSSTFRQAALRPGRRRAHHASSRSCSSRPPPASAASSCAATRHVDGLTIRRRDGTLLAAAARIAVGLDRIDVFGRDARIETVAIDAPRRRHEATCRRHVRMGSVRWLDAAPPASKSASAAARETSWNIRAGKLAVTRGTVALVDETSTFRSTLVDIALDATNVSTQPGEKAHVKLDLVSSDRIASFSGEADVEPSAPAATGRFTLAKFSLGLLFPFYKSALAVDVQKGSIDYASAFALDAAGNLRLSEGEATITDLRLAVQGEQEPMSRVPQLIAAPDRCRCSRPESDGGRSARQRRRPARRTRFRWRIRNDAAREGCRSRQAGGRRASGPI